jgi:hypothetical protein
MFGCSLIYGSILREVNLSRDRSERIGFTDRARFFEVLELHGKGYPNSKKRVVLWFLTGVFPLGLAALVAIQYFHLN